MTDKLLIEALKIAKSVMPPAGMNSVYIDAHAKVDEALAAHRSQQEAAQEPVESDFTDTGRAALLWVLWHHQGGSSPVGQPIRFALGMGADERLGDARIEEAKRWAALAGWSTEKVHKYHPPASTATSESEARIVVPEWFKALAAAEGGNLLAKFIEDNEPVEDAREWRESVRDMLQQVSGRPAVLEEDIDAALSASGQKGEPT